MKQVLVWLAMAGVVVGLATAGCGKGDSAGEGSTGGASSAQGESGKKLVVGFSQIGAESAWRTANTESIKSEAEKRGIELKFADAQQKQENQIKALRTFVAKGVDVIAFSPVVETGWEPVLKEIKAAGIPVILTDRAVDVSDDSLFVTDRKSVV